ncbi:hypothetical protein PInf_004189 [Phytophthora infestans]|nr:hypothetical protein PInf_004189 [Phytophthora infestans]
MNNPDEKTFKQLCRQLSGGGWKARKPKGLSTDFTYVKPGVKGRLDPPKRGEHYFVGEPELMAFGRKEGLLALGLLVQLPADPAPLNAADISEEEGAATVNNGADSVAPDTLSPRVTVAEAALPVLHNTEQGSVAPHPILDDADYHDQHCHLDDAKSEIDGRDDDPLDEFDGDYCLDAMRSENLFDSIRSDDVNFVKNADNNCSELEADDDDNGDDDASDEAVDDVEELDSDEEMDYTFDMAPEDLLELGSSDWEAYDEDHSDEANRYREQNIPVLAASPRTKLLKRQQKDPGVSVPSVEEIMSGLQKFKSIKAHEIVHVIALLFAHAVAPIRVIGVKVKMVRFPGEPSLAT